MTPDSREWGPRLYAYLEATWKDEGISLDAWARLEGVQAPTLSRWRHGKVEPSLSSMIGLARLLGVPLIDLLIAAGVLEMGEQRCP